MSRRGLNSPSWAPKAVVGAVLVISLYFILFGGSSSSVSTEDVKASIKGGTSNGASGRAQELIKRWTYAEQYVKTMKDVGKNELFTMTTCPDKYSIGWRTTPGQVIPEYVGNTCEPWIARFALIFLDRLLDSDMVGLEWSTGSSTQWVLMRVKSLLSIEHHKKWSKMVEDALEKIFTAAELAKRWKLYAVEPLPGTKEKGPDKEDPVKFKDYIAATFLPETEGIYDYISVDGRARVHCLKRALPLLKPEGGILMLDNSEREWYADAFAAIPKHWLMFEDYVNTGERTTIWLSCLPGKCGQDSHVEGASTETVAES